MTREEARQVLERTVAYESDFAEAKRMAIEALSADAEESVTLYATPKATYIRPLTEEIAIEFLQDSGWLPNHDKEIGNPLMVVRCKDCRYRNGKVNRKGFEVCDATGMDITDNDYCSLGERAEQTNMRGGEGE